MKPISLGIKIGVIWFVAEITRASLNGFCMGVGKAVYKRLKTEHKESENAEKKEESAEEE